MGAVVGSFLGLYLVLIHNLDLSRRIVALGLVPPLLILILCEQVREVLEHLLQQPVEFAIEEAPSVPALPFWTLFSKQFLKRTVFATVPWFCMDVALYGMALFTPIILAASGFAHAKNTFWSRDIHALRGALWLDVILVLGFLVGILLVN